MMAQGRDVAVQWVQALLRDVDTNLGADDVSHKLEAALADAGLLQVQYSQKYVRRPEQLQHKVQVYAVCFEVLQHTCCHQQESGIAPLQQRLWGGSLEVAKELSRLHDQQRRQLEPLAKKHQVLRHEHQVLRSNLRSLKLTVQQLLTDVSTLLQHTASARQQQQQQQQQHQQQHQHQQAPAPQHQPTASWSRHVDLQQHLQRTGLAGPPKAPGRRCVSADGTSTAASAGSDSSSHASLVALTMQRLIDSIERMSRHFADCQAGKLIDDYSDSLVAAAGDPAAGAKPISPGASGAAAAGTAVADANSSSSGVRHESSSSSINTDTHNTSSGLDIITGPGRPASSSSTAGSTRQQPSGPGVHRLPRTPSSGSSGGASSRRHGIRTPSAPVVGGVAAAAAAISCAMASAAVPKAASTRPGAHKPLHTATAAKPAHMQCGQARDACEQQQWQQQQVGLQGVRPEDAIRHFFDSEQAKAAADAWFAHTARASGGTLHTSAAAGPGSSNTTHSSSRSSQAPGKAGLQQAAGDGPALVGPHKQPPAGPDATGGDQQQQQLPPVGTPAPAEETAGSDGPSLIQEASGSSSNISSLGPSISEVWRATSEHSDQPAYGTAAVADAESNAHGAAQAGCAAHKAAAAVPQAPSQHAALPHRRPQQQQQADSSSKNTRQQPQGGRGRQGRPAPCGPVPMPAPSARVSLTSSGGATAGSMWGSGSSTLIQQHKAMPRPAQAAAAPPTGGPALPSGPLTAALRRSSSATRRHASSSSTGTSTSTACSNRSAHCGAAGMLGGRSHSANGASQVYSSNGWTAAAAAAAGATSSRSTSSCSHRSGDSNPYSSSSGSSTCTARHHHALQQQAPAGAAEGSQGLVSRGSGPKVDQGGGTGGSAGSNSSSPGSDVVLLGSGNSSAASSPAGESAAAVYQQRLPAAAPEQAAAECGSSPATAGRSMQAAGCGRQQQQGAGGAGVTASASKALRSLDWSDANSAAAAATGGASPTVTGQVQQRQAAAAGQPVAVPLPPRAPVGSQQPPAAQAAAGARGWQCRAAVEPQMLQPQDVAAVQQQQLQVQPVAPCVLATRAQIGLLSPIIEEASCNTTPRTSASDVEADRFGLGRGAFSSSGSCRPSSKLGLCMAVRMCISDDGTADVPVPASSKGLALPTGQGTAAAAASVQECGTAAEEVSGLDGPDALKDAGRADSPKAGRADSPKAGRADSPKAGRRGSVSSVPANTSVVCKDTAPHVSSSGGSRSSSPWRKQDQPQHGADCSSPTSNLPPASNTAAGSFHARWDAGASSGRTQQQQQLVATFPLDVGPLSHSLDSMDTVLMDASCCQSDEERCAEVVSVGSGGKDCQAQHDAAGGVAVAVYGCAGVCEAVLCAGPVHASGWCMLDLQDLLAIVLDVLNDKKAADKRYLASGLPQPTLGCHMQCYVAAKVHINQAAYSSAMSAILTGLEQHKQVQPEIAVFCRVLSDELDEDHFHHRHLKLRQQLQRLATQAALSGTQQQRQDATGAEEPLQLWEDCCSMQLEGVQLQRMLQGWAAERTGLLQLSGQPPVEELVAIWEVGIRQHCGCAPEEAVRAGSAVAALLLWELDQHLQHLKPLADAFRTADVRCRGVLGLEQFRVFCRRLNDAMSDEEVQLLWCDELRAAQHGHVTFTAICRKLLPAM